jgi:hypothetical protein
MRYSIRLPCDLADVDHAGQEQQRNRISHKIDRSAIFNFHVCKCAHAALDLHTSTAYCVSWTAPSTPAEPSPVSLGSAIVTFTDDAPLKVCAACPERVGAVGNPLAFTPEEGCSVLLLRK